MSVTLNLDKQDAYNFIAGLRIRMTASGELVLERWYHRLLDKWRQLTARWRPQYLVTQIIPEEGLITLTKHRWNWWRWRWETE